MQAPPTMPLERLLADLRAARDAVSHGRERAHLSELPHAQAALLLALEDYIDGLRAAGHPVPYRLQNEVLLHRQLCRTNRAAPR